MAGELRTGLMAAGTLGNGGLTKRTVGESYIIQMETSMKDNGKMTEPVAKESTPTVMEQGTQEAG